MNPTLTVAVWGAAGILGAALLTLVGVLINGALNFKLGRGPQILSTEQSLRKEIRELWERMGGLESQLLLMRQEQRVKEDAWGEEKESLVDRIHDLTVDRDQLQKRNAHLVSEIETMNAEFGTLVLANERLEGGLAQANRLTDEQREQHDGPKNTEVAG